MEALAFLASADLTERQKAAYNADMSWLAAKILHAFAGGGRFDIESPTAFAQRLDGKAQPKDTRTAQQIKDNMIAALDD